VSDSFIQSLESRQLLSATSEREIALLSGGTIDVAPSPLIRWIAEPGDPTSPSAGQTLPDLFGERVARLRLVRDWSPELIVSPADPPDPASAMKPAVPGDSNPQTANAAVSGADEPGSLTWRGKTYDAVHPNRWIVTLTPEWADYTNYRTVMDAAAAYGLELGGVLAPVDSCHQHHLYFDGTPEQLDAALAAFGGIAAIAPDFVTVTPTGPYSLAERFDYKIVELEGAEWNNPKPKPDLPDPDSEMMPAVPLPEAVVATAFAPASKEAKPAGKRRKIPKLPLNQRLTATFEGKRGRVQTVRLKVISQKGNRFTGIAKRGRTVYAVRGMLTKSSQIHAELTPRSPKWATFSTQLILT
jgi:hypothetical protein